MPVKLKNVGPDSVSHRPGGQGDPQPLLVEPGQTVVVFGALAAEQPHDDAYVVGDGDAARAYPKAQWELADKPAKAQPAPAEKE